MGVFAGRDLYSAKFITAEITDAKNEIHVIPIKHAIGDYFLAEINREIYCFKIDGSRIKTWRQTLTRSFRKLYYDLNHYQPVSAGDNHLLEEVLRKNSLPNVDNKLLGTLKYLGQREKNQKTQDFTPHQLKELVQVLATKQDEYSEQVRNLTTYLDHLQLEQIVCPVRKISEFLQGELTTTDPKFLGTVVSSLLRTDAEHKKMTNTPITGKVAWAKIILILGLIIGGIVIAVLLYTSGVFSHGLPGLPTLGPVGAAPPTANQLMTQYPTPESLAGAIKSGAVKCTDLNGDLKNMVNTVKPPVC